jgi:TonB family protein
METAVTPPDEAELHLLTDWAEPGRNARIGRSAVLSLVTHGAAIAFLLFVPETFMQPRRPKEPEQIITPLVLPPLTLTQRAPNPDRIVREFRTSDLSPRVQTPNGPSPDPQAAAPRKSKPMPPPPPPKASPQLPLPEPPKVEIAANEPPKLTLPVQPPPTAPQPKPAIDDRTGLPGQHGTSPGLSLDDLAHGGASGLGNANSQGTVPIPSSGAQLPALLSDPKGVDFIPYLQHVKQNVETVWRKIFPKNGKRGYVSVQFAIERDGTVGKVVFAQSTGDRSMDDTAIQAISAGGPFGPLPVQYTEGEIHVQMNFAYNPARQ